MGYGYVIKCSKCDYDFEVMEGVGFAHSPNAVFYGRRGDPKQKWSVAFPDGYYEEGKPLLLSLVNSEKIKEKTLELLNKGASPEEYYGYEPYVCPNCMRFENRFYFKLTTRKEDYEPEYNCTECKEILKRADMKINDNAQVEIVDTDGRKIDWKCPVCGNDRLVDGFVEINWD